MNSIKNISLMAVSVIIALILCEVLTRIFLGHPLEVTKFSKRLMLYEQGENLQNVGKIFKFYPNKSIRHATYYVLGDKAGVNKAIKEYSYDIKTNNLGLVQKRNVEKGKDSYLILGDSFTEGQGATPWFYQLERSFSTDGHQLINGGIHGTGPLQWELLKEHLVKEYELKIDQVMLILIGDDIRRYVWNFSPERLNCLKNSDCEKSLEDSYGFNFSQKTEQQIIQDVMVLHKSASRAIVINQGFNHAIRRIVKSSAFFYRLVMLARNALSAVNGTRKLKLDSIFDANLAAMERLLSVGKKFGKLMIMPAKHEFDSSGAIKWGMSSRRFISWASNKKIPFKICKLLPTDFHMNDGHPNEVGYSKIRKCVSAELKSP